MALVIKRDRFTPLKKQPVYYRDFVASMDMSAGSNDITAVENVDSVKTSIRNIVLTNRGERFFNSEFGCDVRQMLFENIDSGTESAIKSLIELAITNFEPRAKLIDVVVSGQQDINAYTITVVFSTINSPEPQVLDLILTRVR